MNDKDLAPEIEKALNQASDAELYELARRLAKNDRFRKVLARKLAGELSTR
ncbi:hypothetical protein GGP51_003192 [Salinibacter ruber]|uniref:hypothetical protein n=1 Tax=Salinibacter ruber TaxID=146919 RepID=UPI002169ABB3|nr:hypothetical protein [Salinibacter ruber]MCS4191695.1 hypothetical protein [Salinibacter ruber]